MGIGKNVWLTNAEAAAAPLQMTRAGGDNVLDPVALWAVRQGDQEMVLSAERVYRSPVDPSGTTAAVDNHGKAGQMFCEWAGQPVGADAIEARQPLRQRHCVHHVISRVQPPHRRR